MRILPIFLAAFFCATTAQADLLGVRDANLTMLRVHDVGSRFGPPNDSIDVEVVIEVENRDGAFGFPLRDDGNRLVHQGMLDLLRDAMNNSELKVNFDYNVTPPAKNGIINRVWLTR